jgi:hypothetical protein
MNATLERIKSLKEQVSPIQNEIAALEVEIAGLIKIWLRENCISFDDIGNFSIERDFIGVERILYGRWGGEDYAEYTEIPIAYFETENPEEFIWNYLKEKREKESAEKAKFIAEAKRDKEARERKTYEKLKAKYEK